MALYPSHHVNLSPHPPPPHFYKITTLCIITNSPPLSLSLCIMASRLQLCLGFFILSTLLLTLEANGSRVVSSTLSNKGHTESETVNVTFRMAMAPGVGEGFAITGNTSQLGNWDTKHGIRLERSDITTWSGTVEMVAGSVVEFKPVRVVYETQEALEWLYLPENLVLLVPSTDPSVTVLMQWCRAPSSTLSTKKHTELTKMSNANQQKVTKMSNANQQKVTFQLAKHVEFGQGFVITGSLPAIGNWTPQKGLPLSYNDGDVWTGEVTLLTVRGFEYKPVRVVYGSNNPIEWASDPNRGGFIPANIEEPIIIPVRWSSCPTGGSVGGSVETLIREVV